MSDSDYISTRAANATIDELRERITDLETHNARLVAENARLRELLRNHEALGLEITRKQVHANK